jgi:hypothetical protein
MWDFGDPNSGNWTAGAASSSSTPWPRNREYGALAGHVFDPNRDYGAGAAGYNQNSTCSASGSSARAYTVTLTVSATTGPSATATKTICVQSPDQAWGASNTVCIYPNGGSAGSGCPLGVAPIQSAADACSTINSKMGSGKRILLKSGGSYACSSSISISAAGPGLIGVYGGTAQAIVSTNSNFVSITSSDWRVTNLKVTGTNSSGGNGISLNSGANNLAYLNTFSGFYSPLNGAGNFLAVPGGIIETSLGACVSGGSCYAFGIGSYANVVFAGNSGGDTNTHGHYYRSLDNDFAVFAHNTVGPGTGSDGYLGMYLFGSSKNFLISDNWFRIHDYGAAIGIGTAGGAPTTGESKDWVIENNLLDDSYPNAPVSGIKFVCGNQMTVRNNIFRWIGPDPEGAIQWDSDSDNNCPRHDYWVYNNTFLTDSPNFPIGAHSLLSFTGANGAHSNVSVQNNLYWTLESAPPFPPFTSISNPCSSFFSGTCLATKNFVRTGNAKTGLSPADGAWASPELVSNPFTSSAPTTPDDFKLANCTPGSACPIDAGDPISGLYLDMARAVRGSAVSIGAYEPGAQQGSPPPPPVLLETP